MNEQPLQPANQETLPTAPEEIAEETLAEVIGGDGGDGDWMYGSDY